MAYIRLYADEFPYHVWNEYCEICKESPMAISLTIKFDALKDVEAEYEDDEDETDDYDEE